MNENKNMSIETERNIKDEVNEMYIGKTEVMVPIARTIGDVTSEIVMIKCAAQNMALLYACEIGRRLTEAKAMLTHGEWLPWLEEKVLFSQRTAQRFMRLYSEYGDKVSELGANPTPLTGLSITNALSLLAVPEEERESFAEEHNAAALSNSELEKLIKERDEAIKRAEEAETAKAETETLMAETERERDEAEARLNETEDKLKSLEDEKTADDEEIKRLIEENEELRSRPVDVAVEVDEEAVKKAAEEARAEAEKEWKAKLNEAEAAAEGAALKMSELTEKLDAAQEKLANAGAKDKAERERLEKEVEALSKHLMMSDRTVAVFQVHFESVQKAWAELLRLHGEMSTEQAPKMGAALRALAAKMSEEASGC